MKQWLRKRMARLLITLLMMAVTACFVPWLNTNVFAEEGSVTVSIVVENKAATTELKRLLDTSPNFEPFEIAVNDAGDTITLSHAGLKDWEVRDISAPIESVILLLDEDYDGYINQGKKLGHQKVYASETEFNADVAMHQYDKITDGLTLYVQWLRPITEVNLTVAVPKCGYTVSGSDTSSQDPLPEYSVGDEGVNADNALCFWWAEASAQESSSATFSGQVKVADKLYPRAEVNAKYGYYFPSTGVSATVNGVNATDMRSTDATLVFAGEVEVTEHDWDEGVVTTEPTAVADGVMTYECKNFETCGGIKTEPIPKAGYLLSIGKSDGGKVTISTKRDGQDVEPQNDNAAPGNYTLLHGANATLTAVPDEHYRFVGWYKGIVGESGFVEGYDSNGYIDTEPVLTRTGWANSEVYALFEPLIKVTLKGSSIDGGNTAEDYVLEVRKGTPWTNISVSNKAHDILSHFTEEVYAPFGNALRIMTKELSEFSSWEEVNVEDEANHDYQFDADTILYIPLAKTIDAVELTVEAPLCGEESEVIPSSYGARVEKDYPRASSNNEQVKPSGAQFDLTEDYSNAGAVWMEDEETPLEGKIEGGKTYRAELAVVPAFGYQFATEGNPKTLTVTGANGDEEYRESDYSGWIPGDDFFVRFIQFTIDAEHDWSDWAESKAPTCTEPGEETRECKADETHKETREVAIDPDAHEWGDWEVTKAPTCTEPGEETRECKHDAEHKETREGAAALGHDWGEWEVTKSATCSAKGEEARECKADETHKETREVAIDPDAHDWGDWEVTKAPTCTEPGEETRECKHDAEHKETREGAAALGHDWGEWEVTKEPTADAEGEETRKCNRCSETETRAIPKLDPEKVSYRNTAGDGTVWEKGSNITADFTFKRSIDDSETFIHFTDIKVDGKNVSKDDYTAESGSVIVKLKPEYLETMALGQHSITAIFDDDGGDSPSADFTIITANENDPSNDSGSDDNGGDADNGSDNSSDSGDGSSDEASGTDATGSDSSSGDASNSDGSGSASGSGSTSVRRSAKTGDSNDLSLMIIMLIISAAALAVTIGRRIVKR